MAQKRKHDGTAPDIGKLENEKRNLLINGNNQERLQEVISKLDFLYYGIISK